jgi:hypothetical protein
MYRPAYALFLNRLPSELKRDLVKEQVLTSDGISASTLRALFQLNYEDLLRTGHPPVTMLPGRRVTGGEPEGRGVRLCCVGPHGPETHDLRFVVVAAGRRPTPLPFDEQLQEMIDTDAHGDVVVEADYSLRWKGQDRHRIFAQNRARFIHGLPDANLSLLPTRSAVIINSLFGREVFDVAEDCPATIWDWDLDQLRWAEFRGGKVVRGSLVGSCNSDGILDLAYSQLLSSGEVVAGRCTSVPCVLDDGRIRVSEHWQRFGPDGGAGVSVIEEPPHQPAAD